MKQGHSRLLSLESLAARWRVFAMMLVAFARQITLAEKQGALGDVRKAELLEAVLYAALVQLSSEITAAANAPRRTRAEAAAFVYLKTAHALLGVLALMVRRVKAALRALAERLAALAGGPCGLSQRAHSAPLFPPRAIDSS